VSAGFWDVDVLEEHFADIDLEDLGLNLDDLELPSDLIPEDMSGEDEGDFDAEPPVDPISEKGDVYILKSLQKNLEHKVVLRRFYCRRSL